MHISNVGDGIDPEYKGNSYPFMKSQVTTCEGGILSMEKVFSILEAQGVPKLNVLDRAVKIQQSLLGGYSINNKAISSAILLPNMLKSLVNGLPVSRYLWHEKGITPCLSLDVSSSLSPEEKNEALIAQLEMCLKHGIFAAQIEIEISSGDVDEIFIKINDMLLIAEEIWSFGITPIFSIDINDSVENKIITENSICVVLDGVLDSIGDRDVILKLPLPTEDGMYIDILNHPNVLSIWCGDNGFELSVACNKLKNNDYIRGAFSYSLISKMLGSPLPGSLEENINCLNRASSYSIKSL